MGNLRPYPKGTSGNPSGRPKVEDLKRAIRDVLSEPHKTAETTLKAIVNQMVTIALKGNVRAVELLFAYAYGKPKEDTPETPVNFVIMPKPPQDWDTEKTEETKH
jgi:hypothetical protein